MRGPWHIWVVGIVSLVWNSGGGFDYLMVKTANANYLEMLTEAQRQFMEQAPLWFDIGWAFGVWGSVLGALLLLFRSRLAVPSFVASFLGMVSTLVYAIFIASPSALELNTTGQLMFSLAIVVAIILQILYSRFAARRGYLN